MIPMHATPPAPADTGPHPIPSDINGLPVANLPAVVATAGHRDPRRLRRLSVLVLVIVVATGLGSAYWWTHRAPPVPPGIAYGNGRLEADPIDIATKFAGRIAGKCAALEKTGSNLRTKVDELPGRRRA